MTALYEEGNDELPEIEVTAEQLVEHREECRDVITIAEAAVRLSQNSDFIKVVMEKYFTDEPARLGSLISSGRLTPKQSDECVSDLKSIGSIRAFMHKIIQDGQTAKEHLDGMQAQHEAFFKNHDEDNNNNQ